MARNQEKKELEVSYINLMYECPDCKHIFDDLVRRSDRDTGTECPICETECPRTAEVMTAPNVTRASRVDGRTSDATKRLVEASKLESEMFNLPPKKRAEHKEAIAELKSTKEGRAKRAAQKVGKKK